MQRRNFLFNAATGLGSLIVLPSLLKAQTSPQQNPDPYPVDLVKEFVIAGHSNLEKTQAMVKEHPNLVHGKYDWGNGDFEEAIEGAGHLGNKPIANFLIDSGARVTLFVLTMLGKTELVKPILEQYPHLVFANGPHGFTMLHHAKMGGKDGEPLYAYLESKGLDKTWVKIK
ncbi:MAG: hypothetical protein NVS3B19_12950 [Ginsengibacter sp.]